MDQKKGIGELGPLWITAITGLIVAVTGFFVGRATGSEASSPPPTHTVTVTAPAPQPGESTPAGPDHVGSAVVEWEGALIWGSYNLDFKPPKDVPGKNFTVIEDTLYTNNIGEAAAGTVADWQTDSVPGLDECRTAVTERGSNNTNRLVSDSYVCGRTAEGRIFRIHVVVAGESEIQSQVTVWADDTP